MLFAQSISIEYVWIDSLCIVQDDKEDWASEADRMGTIYRDAFVVLAAADAEDSTEGFFITDRPKTEVIKIPYLADGVAQGTLNFAETTQNVYMMSNCILNKRAWVLQEVYLAQKIVYFTFSGMLWRCISCELTERGSDYEQYSIPDRSSWCDILEYYSYRELTYPEDRLHALRGIVDELQKNRRDRYFYEYGVWEDGLYQQLLWKSIRPHEQGLPDIPTWCWAASEGPKAWFPCFNRSCTIPEYNVSTSLNVLNNGTLAASGYITNTSLSVFSSPWQAFREAEIAELRDNHPLGVIWDQSCDKRLLGIASFDTSFMSNITCFFLNLHQVEEDPRTLVM